MISDSMVRLSVNVNKVATLRNSRGGRDAERARRGATSASTPARPASPSTRAPTERHITPADVRDDRARAAASRRRASNSTSRATRGPTCSISSHEVRPDQCTLVPVVPGEITSQAGWRPGPGRRAAARRSSRRLQARGVRVSLFVDPEPEPIRWAASIGADRVELYTEPFARAFERGATTAARVVRALRRGRASWRTRSGWASTPATTSTSTTSSLFRELPHLDEVSIGHAIMSRALFVGLATVVREYLAAARVPPELALTAAIRL